MSISFEDALRVVREELQKAGFRIGTESLALDQVQGRVLAEAVCADRDYPPFHRSARDGYAVRSSEIASLPALLHCVGEARAGEPFLEDLSPGTCVRIMTGAAAPAAADAVVMQEYTRAEGDRVEVLRSVSPGENIVSRGSEAASGSIVIPQGRRLGAGEIGLLASVGRAKVTVFRRPVVAILPTGDEIVPVESNPKWFQIRNSNAAVLAAQVSAAGGTPRTLPIAPDRQDRLRELVEESLAADLLLLSGGVSVGKYDFVEQALAELGAEFYFTSAAIRPGKPVTFGRARGKFFFGLPGNPVSTFVTFELFAKPAVATLGGGAFEPPVFLRARLAKALHNRTGLTTFMPARVETSGCEPVVQTVGWQGSGDMVGLAAANCFLVARPEQTELAAGVWADVLWRG